MLKTVLLLEIAAVVQRDLKKTISAKRVLETKKHSRPQYSLPPLTPAPKNYKPNNEFSLFCRIMIELIIPVCISGYSLK